jgi:glycosyltransferase involved in cell wall biosynthesis
VISILLSTYNGNKYLKEQIDSIINQSVSDWRLYIRDDGSTDNTVKIINEYCERYQDKIENVTDNSENLGADKSFMLMLSKIDSDYLMFCDQDDVWLPFKIEKTMQKMNEIEKEYINKPIVIFTDLTIVDENLNTISASMWKFSKINPEYSKNIYYHSVSSSVSGCTMLMNKKVKEYVLPYPDEALMHDWWIALHVAYYGIVDYISEQTILYRQHGKNRIGAENSGKNHYLNRLLKIGIVINENIEVIKMLNKCSFKINHLKRILMKFKIILIKSF